MTTSWSVALLLAIRQTKIIQTLHRKFYDYLSHDIHSEAAHILSGPLTMQVINPLKLNTRKIQLYFLHQSAS